MKTRSAHYAESTKSSDRVKVQIQRDRYTGRCQKSLRADMHCSMSLESQRIKFVGKHIWFPEGNESKVKNIVGQKSAAAHLLCGSRQP